MGKSNTRPTLSIVIKINLWRKCSVHLLPTRGVIYCSTQSRKANQYNANLSEEIEDPNHKQRSVVGK